MPSGRRAILGVVSCITPPPCWGFSIVHYHNRRFGSSRVVASTTSLTLFWQGYRVDGQARSSSARGRTNRAFPGLNPHEISSIAAGFRLNVASPVRPWLSRTRFAARVAVLPNDEQGRVGQEPSCPDAGQSWR